MFYNPKYRFQKSSKVKTIGKFQKYRFLQTTGFGREKTLNKTNKKIFIKKRKRKSDDLNESTIKKHFLMVKWFRFLRLNHRLSFFFLIFGCYQLISYLFDNLFMFPKWNIIWRRYINYNWRTEYAYYHDPSDVILDSRFSSCIETSFEKVKNNTSKRKKVRKKEKKTFFFMLLYDLSRLINQTKCYCISVQVFFLL